jgi:hypothetical protein
VLKDKLKNGKKYLQVICLTRGYYPEYVRNSTQPPFLICLKMGKGAV